jgi:hypothetical protein
MRIVWKPRWWHAVLFSALLAPVAAAQSTVTQAIVPIRVERRSESAIAWVQNSGAAGSITGRVVASATLAALGDAVAQVEDTTGHMLERTRPDADGAFRFAPLRPGTYQVRVNRIGYAIARATVLVPTDGSIRLTALMAEKTYY